MPAFIVQIMKFTALTLLCLVGVNFAAVVKNGYNGYKVHRLTLDTQEQLDFLVQINEKLIENEQTNEIDFWTDSGLLSPNVAEPILVMVSPLKETEFLQTLDEKNIKHEVTVPDLAAAIDENMYLSPAERQAEKNGVMTWTAYHDYPVIESFVKKLAADHPSLVTITTLGQSYEGRNVYLLKIGKPRADGKTKPAVWMDSQIHAREWIASATLTYMINEMVTKYGSSAMSTRMLDQVDWYVLPVVNVDGFAFTHASSSNRMWRKTRRVNPFATAMGADPNRNYDHKWMHAGASQTASGDIYAGAYPFSEIENVYLTDAVLQHQKQIKTLLTFHSAAEMWLLPWGYDSSVPADFADLRTMGVRATEALYKHYKIRYAVGSSTQLLGAAAGATDDWGKSKGMVKYSVTVELRTQGYGFVLPANQIIPSGIETLSAIEVVGQMVYDEYGPTLD